MGSDGLRYDRMVEDALRSVVRRSLIHIAQHGLPGSHHFYITFRTDHLDSEIPDALRERYPGRSEEHTSELESLMRISYAVFCLKQKKISNRYTANHHNR